ncbi:MAG: zinc ribbon domain-containing protein [Caldilineales bacterium]|nr:zinc ribbon domain-containing protein [Caldilineales bacterium]
MRSETLILLITYFFRHTWGWHGHQHEPCWLSEEDIAHGRRFADPARKGERYDEGIGYTGRAVRKALKEGVERGWLVWRYQGNGRIFALRLEGMTVSEDGQIIEPTDPTPDAVDTISPTSSERSTAVVAQSKVGTEQSAAIMTASDPDSPEQSTVAAEQTAAMLERSTAALAQSTAPPIDQDRDRSDPTDNPPQKTTTETVSALGNGIADTPGYSQNGALPLALQEQVRLLGLKGRGPQRELLQAWQEDPQRIDAWLQHLVNTRRHDPQAAGFLLQVVVRQRASAPNGGSKAMSATCAACQGSRHLRIQVPAGDPHHRLVIPCPSCTPTAAHT